MAYEPPKQHRAKVTERKFLIAFEELLRLNGFANASIDDIAARAGLNRAAFLSRFGSKEAALLLLFRGYCDQATKAMAEVGETLGEYQSVHKVLFSASVRFEALLQMHLGSNRAMHERFLETLEVHDLTKEIFRQCVEMMSKIQQHFYPSEGHTIAGAMAASQILVTIDYNSVLRAMPALPSDHTARHHLIADILEVSLKR